MNDNSLIFKTFEPPNRPHLDLLIPSKPKNPFKISLPSNTDRSVSHKSVNQSAQSTRNISPRPQSPTFPEHMVKKPISLAILEKYFSDICQSISIKSSIDPSLSSKAETMHGVLKDCLKAIHDLSLEIYLQMASSLKDIQQIHKTQDNRLISGLTHKLLKISEMIEDNKYRSESERVINQPNAKEIDKEIEKTSAEDLAVELKIRISRVTARILNI